VYEFMININIKYSQNLAKLYSAHFNDVTTPHVKRSAHCYVITEDDCSAVWSFDNESGIDLQGGPTQVSPQPNRQ